MGGTAVKLKTASVCWMCILPLSMAALLLVSQLRRTRSRVIEMLPPNSSEQPIIMAREDSERVGDGGWRVPNHANVRDLRTFVEALDSISSVERDRFDTFMCAQNNELEEYLGILELKRLLSTRSLKSPFSDSQSAIAQGHSDFVRQIAPRLLSGYAEYRRPGKEALIRLEVNGQALLDARRRLLDLTAKVAGAERSSSVEMESLALNCDYYEGLLELVVGDRDRLLSNFRRAIRLTEREELASLSLADSRLESVQACVDAEMKIGHKRDPLNQIAVEILEDYRFLLQKSLMWRQGLVTARTQLLDLRPKGQNAPYRRAAPVTASKAARDLGTQLHKNLESVEYWKERLRSLKAQLDGEAGSGH